MNYFPAVFAFVIAIVLPVTGFGSADREKRHKN